MVSQLTSFQCYSGFGYIFFTANKYFVTSLAQYLCRAVKAAQVQMRRTQLCKIKTFGNEFNGKDALYEQMYYHKVCENMHRKEHGTISIS